MNVVICREKNIEKNIKNVNFLFRVCYFEIGGIFIFFIWLTLFIPVTINDPKTKFEIILWGGQGCFFEGVK